MEFIATVQAIEKLLALGASYEMARSPQYGVNLIRWDNISAEAKKGINLNNCPYINTLDSFTLNGVSFYPIKG